MSIFDFVSEKVNEVLGGGVDEVANQIQDAGSQQLDDVTQQVGDATQSVEDTIAQASEIFPGDNSDEQ